MTGVRGVSWIVAAALFGAVSAAPAALPGGADPPADKAVKDDAKPPTPIVMVGKTDHDVYRIVKVAITGLPAKAGVVWRARPGENVDWGLGGKRNLPECEWTAPPGQYEIEATVVIPTPDGGFTIDLFSRVFTVKGREDRRDEKKADPAPDPRPKPDPKPDPAPVVLPAGEVWLIAVEESATRTEKSAAVLADTAYWQGLAGKGLQYRHYDETTPSGAAYLKLAASHQVASPALLLVDRRAKFLGAVPMPPNTAGVTEFVAKYVRF